jgi:phosphoribosylanthranilate isomerase
LAIELGADALGFIHERSSKRFIGDGELKWIAALPPIPLKIAVFGVVDRPIVRGLFDAIQGVEWNVYPEPSSKRIHVVRPREGQKPEDVMNGVVPASAVLIDAYSSEAYGGTGKRVDLNFAAEVVARSHVPVILAGGLNPDNVADVVSIVRPFCVDVSTGVEEKPGIKDAAKMRDFIAAVRGV